MSESQNPGNVKGQSESMSDNKLLEEYLNGDSEISHAYKKLKSVETTAELDQSILNIASSDIANHQATHQEQSKFEYRTWGRKLDSPFAMAAVLVLCASLILIFSQQEQIPEYETAPDLAPVPATAEMPSAEKQNSGLSDQSIADDNVAEEPDRIQSSMMLEEEAEQAPAESSVIREMGEMKSKQVIQSHTQHKIQERTKEKSLSAAPLKKERSSIESLSNDIKSLIAKGKIDDAKVLYQNFKTEFPDVDVTRWFSREELLLLQR